MGHYSGNSGLVGKPKNPTSSAQSGIWTITEANLQSKMTLGLLTEKLFH